MGGLSHTVSGDIASFRTPSRVPIESLKIHFLPKQEGSGDPSPTNIRPITGWNGCNLKRAKKNLLDENNPNIYYIGAEKSNGIFTNTVTDTRDGVQVSIVGYKNISTPIDVLKSSAIITSPSTVQLTAIITQSYSEMTYLCVKHNGKSKDFKVMFPITIPVGTKICVSVDILSTDVGTVGGFKMNNIQIEVGDASTAYESYSGSVIPVTFPDGQTIYGGYIDPVKGEIWKEYDEIVFDGSDADTFTYHHTSDSSGISRHYYNTKVLDRIVKTNSTSSAYSDSATPTSNSFEHRTTISFYIGTPTNQVLLNIVATECDPTAESFNSYLQNHPVRLVYKLATPVLVATFDPITLKTFLDHNNFWSDANDITEVTYAVTESKDILATRKKAMDFDHAHHKKVKWNQLARDISTSHWRMYSSSALRGTISDGIAECYYITDKQYARYVASITTINSISWDADHYYYASYMVKPTYNGNFGIEFARGKQVQAMAYAYANEWKRACTIQKSKATGLSGLYIPFPDPVGPMDEGYQVKALFVVDLTLMFGAGNEPTRAEFERICEINGIDLTTYQPYDVGSDRWIIVP